MKKSIKFHLTVVLVFSITSAYSQIDNPPVLTAQGNQPFCLGESIHIVTDFSISDSDNTGIGSFFIQISSGYQIGFDVLSLEVVYPSISVNWSETEGKLTLTSSNSTEILLTVLEQAVKDVTFLTTATNVTVEKTFSLTIGDANYLPLTDHFYEFVDSSNILWTQAEVEAETRTYFGRQGYLATLTSQEEANFAGKQAAGAGWIGASDIETEGEWKWVTGPEAGTVFWNGVSNGSTVDGQFAFWNRNEPNDFRGNNVDGEHYAHITDPSINIVGAWNDLPNEGGTDLYIPKGYIVEYGTPDDPQLSIVATTIIYIPIIDDVNGDEICVSENATITAVDNEGDGIIKWYDAPVDGNEIGSGTNLSINVAETTSFYAAVSVNNCNSTPRVAVLVTVNNPEITATTDDLICFGEATLTASSNVGGNINWYDSLTSIAVLATGNTFTTQITETTSFYVEAEINGCTSLTRTEVIAEINSVVPSFDVVDDIVFLCANIGSVLLETINRQNTNLFRWTKDGELLVGEIDEDLLATSSGIYEVKAFSVAGCESLTQTIVVSDSEIATITNSDVLIEDNSIKIKTNNLGVGTYEFALNDEFGAYGQNTFFENLDIGAYTVFIRDVNGCGITSYQFSILNFNDFFTPNGDGKNDTWNITGFDASFFSVVEIFIYDRFGKLLYQFEENSLGWNGTYQGKKLPEDDYWYRVLLTDLNGKTIEKLGNFSLILK